jgi:NAD(P)-dependent dehydrogenase (short-subunit alcohol dehydrogenase family)
MSELLEGKRIVITGATRGIGRGFARCLAAHGAAVVVNGTASDAVASLVAEIEADGGRAIGLAGSVADDSTVERLVDLCVRTYGGIDVMIPNAGIAREVPFMDSTVADFDRTISVNLRGTWSACRHASRAMVDSGGLLLLISSAAAVVGYLEQSSYAASKGGVMGLFYTLATELEPYRIRVNTLGPSALTDMNKQRWDRARRVVVGRGEVAPSPAAMGYGDPEDVAPIVAFLCSDQGAEITGQFIRFNGRKLEVWRRPDAERTIERETWSLEDLAHHLLVQPDANVTRLLGSGDDS